MWLELPGFNKLYSDDLVSMNRELAAITGTRWINGEYVK